MSDQPKDTRLWCLHHIGADDIYPAPDFATAQNWADWANTHFADHADISRFVVAVWPHAASNHAAGLENSVRQWTVPAEATVKQSLTVGERPNPDWPAATAALVALAEHGIEADFGEVLTQGNPSRGIAPGAIFKVIAAINLAQSMEAP